MNNRRGIFTVAHTYSNPSSFSILVGVHNSVLLIRWAEFTISSVRVLMVQYCSMKNLRYHFPTCYAYPVKEPIGELNLKRALDEDTGVFSSFFSLLSSTSPLGQTAVSGNSTLHQ